MHARAKNAGKPNVEITLPTKAYHGLDRKIPDGKTLLVAFYKIPGTGGPFWRFHVHPGDSMSSRDVIETIAETLKEGHGVRLKLSWVGEGGPFVDRRYKPDDIDDPGLLERWNEIAPFVDQFKEVLLNETPKLGLGKTLGNLINSASYHYHRGKKRALDT